MEVWLEIAISFMRFNLVPSSFSVTIVVASLQPVYESHDCRIEVKTRKEREEERGADM